MRIRVRKDPYSQLCLSRGLTTMAAQGAAFGTSEAYVSRLLRGKTGATDHFIANVLVTSLPALTFHDLFELDESQQRRTPNDQAEALAGALTGAGDKAG